MTFYVENETDKSFPFSPEEIMEEVGNEILRSEGCPYEVQVNLLLTDNEGIREFNRSYRNIDKETDVLSFPNLEYIKPGQFTISREEEASCFDPDSGELILGDIILSVDKVASQAHSYGHDMKREMAFLIAHSMLHLCGYDHMEKEEEAIMEKKQEDCLQKLCIFRK